MNQLYVFEGEIEVNFPNEMKTLIKEASCLDKMGFELSEITLNVALQSLKFKEYIESLNTMLTAHQKVLKMKGYYNNLSLQALQQLNEVERGLLRSHLAKLDDSLTPGLSALNWYSLGIMEFIKTCTNAINQFNSIVSQVKKNSTAIESILGEVVKTQLFVGAGSQDQTKELSQFLDDFETHIDNTIEKLISRTNTLPQFLTKVHILILK